MSEKEELILEISNLSKTFRSNWLYRPLKAVNEVNLNVKKGEAFGFLGHNGAGKTTTIKCIIGLIHKTSGSILYQGKPLQSSEQYKTIGYLPEHPYFYGHLSVKETLEFFAKLHGLSDIKNKAEEVLEKVHLTSKAKAPIKALSKGLQQRLGIAQSIINSPKFLILDEPFSGLDPLGRKDIRELILELKEKGTTVLMSSHILSDVEDICDRVSIISKGTVKASFLISEIPEKFGSKFELIFNNFNPEKEPFTAIKQGALSSKVIKTSNKTLHALYFNEPRQANAALNTALEEGAGLESFQNKGASLEEIFMEITGEEYKEEKRSSIDKGIIK